MPRKAGTTAVPRQGGMILLTVVFVMIVLGLLAALLARGLGDQYAQGALAQASQQARFAAASGIEWASVRARQAGVCGTSQVTLADFTVTVTCNSAAITEGAASYTVFDLQAEARRGTYGNPDFVRRTAQRRVTDR
jgi:type II secretory pathway pseudopilin PulG